MFSLCRWRDHHDRHANLQQQTSDLPYQYLSLCADLFHALKTTLEIPSPLKVLEQKGEGLLFLLHTEGNWFKIKR